MKNRVIFGGLMLSLSILTYNCATKTTTTTSTEVDYNNLLSAAKKRWPDATVESLSLGNAVYTGKCGTCHSLKKIPGHSEAYWEHEIESMSPKAKLTSVEKENLRKYILSVLDTSK